MACRAAGQSRKVFLQIGDYPNQDNRPLVTRSTKPSFLSCEEYVTLLGYSLIYEREYMVGQMTSLADDRERDFSVSVPQARSTNKRENRTQTMRATQSQSTTSDSDESKDILRPRSLKLLLEMDTLHSEQIWTGGSPGCSCPNSKRTRDLQAKELEANKKNLIMKSLRYFPSR